MVASHYIPAEQLQVVVLDRRRRIGIDISAISKYRLFIVKVYINSGMMSVEEVREAYS
jgi:hypothetical protein